MQTNALDGSGAPAHREHYRGRMQLGSVDLNLLVPLQALLEERSVSRAAERLYMSQPALSASLARLRRHFNDELLIRSGNQYVLSPLGLELLEEAHTAVGVLSRVFGTQDDFRAEESRREFRIVCSDYVAAVFGGRLSRIVSDAAPNAQVRFDHVSDAIVDEAPDSLRDVDGLVLPHGYFEASEHIDLFTDSWACIVADDEGELTVDALGSRPWAVTYSGRTAVTNATRQLHMLGIHPRTEVVTRSFLSLPDMVTGTKRVAFVPASLTERWSLRSDIRVVESPLELPDLRQAFWWSGANSDDPGHRWLRDRVYEAAVAESPVNPRQPS